MLDKSTEPTKFKFPVLGNGLDRSDTGHIDLVAALLSVKRKTEPRVKNLSYVWHIDSRSHLAMKVCLRPKLGVTKDRGYRG
jgi:hypothetical protein